MIFIKRMREFHRRTENAACLMADRRQRRQRFSRGEGKSAGDRGRHTAGGRSLMPCRRVGQRTLARTASAATRSRTNDPANIQSKNITGSSFRLFLEPRFPGSGWPTCFLPPMNEGKRGFEGQKFAHTAGPLDHTASMVEGLSLAEQISAPTKLQSTGQRWVFECFLRCRWVSAHHGEKQRKDALSGVFALVHRW